MSRALESPKVFSVHQTWYSTLPLGSFPATSASVIGKSSPECSGSAFSTGDDLIMSFLKHLFHCLTICPLLFRSPSFLSWVTVWFARTSLRPAERPHPWLPMSEFLLLKLLKPQSISVHQYPFAASADHISCKLFLQFTKVTKHHSILLQAGLPVTPLQLSIIVH